MCFNLAGNELPRWRSIWINLDNERANPWHKTDSLLRSWKKHGMTKNENFTKENTSLIVLRGAPFKQSIAHYKLLVLINFLLPTRYWQQNIIIVALWKCCQLKNAVMYHKSIIDLNQSAATCKHKKLPN